MITKYGLRHTQWVCLILLLHFALLAAQERPNVLFIISDQHKFKALGCYGDRQAITPHMDTLAKNGVRLTNCYVAAPVCAMSRAAYITGMEPYANGAIYHKAPVKDKNGKEKRLGSGFLRKTGYHEGIVTLPQIFRDQGYITASPGKMHVHGELQKNIDPQHPKGNDLGFDEISLRYYTNFPGGHYADEVGMDTYQRYRQLKPYRNIKRVDDLNTNYLATHVVEDEDNFDMVVTKKSIEFLEKRGHDKKPFFLHVGLEKPHPPFTTAQRYLDMYNPDDFNMPDTHDDWYKHGKYPWIPDWVHSGLPKLAKKKAKNVMASYYACVSQVDDMVGRLIKSLKEQGLYENTIIIYTTDHGEHLFEHGMRGKHNMYEASVKIPFIISHPKSLPSNITNDSLISLLDLMPFFSDVLGIQKPSNAMGTSFLETIKSKKDIKNRRIHCEYRSGNYKAFPKQKDLPSRMQRYLDHKYVYTHGIVDQLYHVVKDPNELNNLALSPEYKQIVRQKRFETLAKWRFDQYRALDIEKNSGTIAWEKHPHAKSYTIFHSNSSDHTTAKPVVIESNMTEHKFSMPGYYWVMAEPNYTRTSPRFPKRPVLVADHSFILPISDAIHISR
jgi:arylsulfatase A-like enzyme